jgi:polyhydroxyalkanoate synthesis regulator phasin
MEKSLLLEKAKKKIKSLESKVKYRDEKIAKYKEDIKTFEKTVEMIQDDSVHIINLYEEERLETIEKAREFKEDMIKQLSNSKNFALFMSLMFLGTCIFIFLTS